jgi:hypothetical protein
MHQPIDYIAMGATAEAVEVVRIDGKARSALAVERTKCYMDSSVSLQLKCLADQARKGCRSLEAGDLILRGVATGHSVPLFASCSAGNRAWLNCALVRFFERDHVAWLSHAAKIVSPVTSNATTQYPRRWVRSSGRLRRSALDRTELIQ